MSKSKHQARFSQLPRRAVMDSSLSPTDFKVLAIIGLYLNHDHEAWPMQETIGEIGGMSKSTVSRSIKRLEAAGYILSRKKYPNSPGTHKCYAVVMDEFGQDDAPETVKSDTSENVTDATPELRLGCNSGISSKGATPIRTNPIELTHKNPGTDRADGCDAEDDLTQAIWSILPIRKRSLTTKAKIAKALKKALKGKTSPEQLIRAAENCYRLPRHTEQGGQFAPAAYSFFAEGIWENWLEGQSVKQQSLTREDWQAAFREFAESGTWLIPDISPPPNHPDCKGPPEMIEHYRKLQERAA